MQNNNFAETLASVASEFGVEDTEKYGRGIKPSKRPYFRWTEEQLEQLTALWDTTSRTCERATVCRYAIRSSTAAMEPVRPVSRSSWECKGHWVTSRSRSACIFPTSMPAWKSRPLSICCGISTVRTL